MLDNQECRGTLDGGVKTLLATCGRRCRLAGLDDIACAIREANRGKEKAWIEQWLGEEGPKWVNNMDTVVFEFPLEDMAGEKALQFTQMVWRCQPRDFWFQVWGSRCFVRLWWDPARVLGETTR